jgi:hypothetical protein
VSLLRRTSGVLPMSAVMSAAIFILLFSRVDCPYLHNGRGESGEQDSGIATQLYCND